MTDKTKSALDEMGGNAFEHILRNHRRGMALGKASSLLAEAVKSARDTGKAATVTVKVTLKPQREGDDQMMVDIQPTAKLPEEKLPASLFWVGEDETLHTSDPRQRELPLREVARSDGQAEPRDVANG